MELERQEPRVLESAKEQEQGREWAPVREQDRVKAKEQAVERVADPASRLRSGAIPRIWKRASPPARPRLLLAVSRCSARGAPATFYRGAADRPPFRNTFNNCRLSFDVRWPTTLRHWPNDFSHAINPNRVPV